MIFYQCEYCGKKFKYYNRFEYYRHLKKAHGVKI